MRETFAEIIVAVRSSELITPAVALEATGRAGCL
jgi:hypothetical protein